MARVEFEVPDEVYELWQRSETVRVCGGTVEAYLRWLMELVAKESRKSIQETLREEEELRKELREIEKQFV